MPSKPKPKPAKARKPMVVWVVVDKDRFPCMVWHRERNAEMDAKYCNSIHHNRRFRAVRFIEAPLRRKGGEWQDE